MNKIGGFIKLMRPVNCAMMGFAVFVGVLLAQLQLDLNWFNILYGFLTGFTLCAAAMVINDYYDRKIDAINEPKRPIPSGTIKPKEALAFMTCLIAIGLIFALLVSPHGLLCVIVAAASLAITATYLTIGKRSGLPGNFLVSACVAIPFIYGSITISGTVGLNVLLFAAMAFLSNTGREITKGIIDVKGDKMEGVKTLAVQFGEKKAALAAVAFFLLAVALTPITWHLKLVGILFIPLVLVTDIGLIACSALLLLNPSREKARKIKNIVLLLFLIGLLAYLFGVLSPSFF
ncbi:MAG: geranylgeranylglycerol-phosphate geranylgeranyltransferase [Candidatus Bathyarchaeota archaeon]|uniref:geranylgeranylglycerol-phosphate geranylgeranyltransferase n=1 Tax=Candidatus Bathycorpusculum sp. TaxID=2994959 RepID=UPI00281A4CB6|nr:geranylgeranylglycerol-phosphate geranylgeranyltransferase [Candidatus Termiticorpusculum sp.]MCL2257005.1 geranylgeranylglycerol-phosphate geranylgeranyltransferase [Candidatus Termiticorpusculum sp.]MCL2292871.1 geranylgeranylglycerol-phosphate geranylgeranyltransferase [Candidatus Termiticorpusculum sp.]